ncbi:hypothetical protein Tco_0210587 [Tanacetum coccineum]
MLRLKRLGSNTETGVPYTEEEIIAIVRRNNIWAPFPCCIKKMQTYPVARESIPGELSPSIYPGRHVTRDCSSVSSSTKGAEKGNGGRLSTSGSGDVEVLFSDFVNPVVRAQPKDLLAVKKEWAVICIQYVFRSFSGNLLTFDYILPF